MGSGCFGRRRIYYGRIFHNGQDEYIKSLDRVIINVNEPQVERIVQNNKCTFQSLLYNATISNRRLIIGVETVPKKLTASVMREK